MSTVVGMMETASAWCECENVAVFRVLWYGSLDRECESAVGREAEEKRQRVCDRIVTDGLTECLSNAKASREGALRTMLGLG